MVIVSGSTPLVDTQNVSQQRTISKELLDAVPSGSYLVVSETADDVDAREEQALFFEGGADSGADFIFARGEFGGFRAAAGMHVGARIALGGNTIDGTERLAVDEDEVGGRSGWLRIGGSLGGEDSLRKAF